MTILEKLHKIEEQKTIYNIHYCNAGVGFLFYYPEKDIGRSKHGRTSFMNALSVEEYYPTFEEAVEAEYARLEA